MQSPNSLLSNSNTSASTSTASRLLVVEPDAATRNNLLLHFRSLAYSVTTTSDGASALNLLRSSGGYDLVVTELTVPEYDGFSLLEHAQEMGVEAAFLVLTERSSLEDRLRGFQLGADDYVTKPFSPKELEARVEAILSRRHTEDAAPQPIQTFGDFSINFTLQRCYYDGSKVHLTDLEFGLLAYLVRNRGRAVPREELLDQVWGPTRSVSTRTVDRYVAKLRKKLERSPTVPKHLQTICGKGYRFTKAAS